MQFPKMPTVEDAEQAARMVARLSRATPSEDRIAWLLEHRELAIPPLVAVLRRNARAPTAVERRSDAPLHALLILGALEAAEAWPEVPAVLAFFQDPYFDDTLGTFVPWALAGLGAGDEAPLRALSAAPEAHRWVRDSARHGLVIRALRRPAESERIGALLWSQLEAAAAKRDRDTITDAVGALSELGIEAERRDDVHRLFKRGLVDPQAFREPDLYDRRDDFYRQLATASLREVYRRYRAFFAQPPDPRPGRDEPHPRAPEPGP